MEQSNNMRIPAVDNARLMTRLAVIGAVTSGILLLLSLSLGVLKVRFSGSDVFALSVIPFSLAFLFSLGSVIYGMLAGSAALEEEEKVLLSKRAESRALNVEEDVRFTAGRSFENYRHYAPYVLALLAAAMVFLFLYLFFQGWSARDVKAVAENPLHGTVVAALMTFAGVFSGAFFVGQSRQAGFRWLRPVGAWLIAGFGVMFTAMIVGIFFIQKVLVVDVYAAKVIFWIFVVLGAEFVGSFIIEFYRPRTMREDRPIFESRLLALFTEPGGVMRNIALTLDYQFGFKVSGTWLYNFMEKSFFPLLLFWLVMLWGFSMIHEVGPSEVGVRMHLGKIVEKQLLTPGIYWTLPWPFGTVERYSQTEIQEVVVGSAENKNSTDEEIEDDGHGHGKSTPKQQNEQLTQVVLWTAGHGASETNFIVAVPDTRNLAGDSGATPIDFIRVQLPIQYRIRNVMDYAFKNMNAKRTLKFIGQQAVTEYLASSSIMALMSDRRIQAQQAIAQRVQQLADEHNLGVEIVAVTLMDAHPPIEKVAPAFQSVIGAMEEKESIILKAKTYAAVTLPLAESQSARIVADAQSYRYKVTTVSRAEADRFNTQLKTYLVMPSMFRLKAYLDMLEKDCRNIRKFVVASGLNNEVYELNFEQKERLDLVDADISKLSN